MKTISPPFSIAIGAAANGAYPAWRQGKAVDVPFQISNTAAMNGIAAPYDFYGNQSHTGYAIDYWNGLAPGPRALWSVAAGGDGAAQNGVFHLDLSLDAPQWVMDIAPFAGYDATAAHYSNGSPVARHTYHSTQWISAAHAPGGLERAMVFTDYAAYGVFAGGQFGAGPQVDGFKTGAKTWDAAGTFPSLPSGMWASTSTAPISFAKHPTTEIVYASAGYQYAKWSPATNLWIDFTGSVTTSSGGLIAYDHFPSIIDVSRNRWLCILFDRARGGTIPRCQAMNLATNVVTTFDITGAFTDTRGAFGGALMHDLDNDRYVLFWQAANGGYDVWNINPTTWNSTLIANIATLPGLGNSMYSRAHYLQELGGIAYVPAYQSNAFFMPTRS